MPTRKPKSGRPRAPGLSWVKRVTGETPYWIAPKIAVRAGYVPKTLSLVSLKDQPEELVAICHRMQAEVLEWLDGPATVIDVYDGTIGSLARVFLSHEDSPIRGCRHDTQEYYETYCRLLDAEYGARRVTKLIGPDFRKMFATLSEPAKEGGARRVRRAQSAMGTLRRIVSFGVEMRFTGCAEVSNILRNMRFEGAPARRKTLTLAHAQAIIATAHQMGRHSVAIAQAIAFDLTLRQKDIIGEWTPADRAGGGIVDRSRRWSWGLVWSDLDEHGVLSKPTSKSNGRRVLEFKVDLYPLVAAEIAKVAAERRIGPMIVNEQTGLPYKPRKFSSVWRSIATAAGVPKDVWQMDSRAGGLTEATDAGANLEDARHQAGHSNASTTARYSRGSLEKTSKVAELRAAHRSKNVDRTGGLTGV